MTTKSMCFVLLLCAIQCGARKSKLSFSQHVATRSSSCNSMKIVNQNYDHLQNLNPPPDVSSPFPLPPFFDSLPPLCPDPTSPTPSPIDTVPGSPETSPSPTDTSPNPLGNIPIPPDTSPSPEGNPPSPLGNIPIPPDTFPSPEGNVPIPPDTFPSPEGNIPSPLDNIPIPPDTFPSPEGNIPSPEGNVPIPPDTFPSPEGNIPSPLGNIPIPPDTFPSPEGNIPSPLGNIPIPPDTFPSPEGNIPGPPSGLDFGPAPPIFGPPAPAPPPVNGNPGTGLWCVAKPSVPDPIIQEALNYACGSGADCGPIQPSGSCFQPDTVYAHASYAFNDYWQRSKATGGTCEFGGTAMLVAIDPSYNGCHFMYT